MWAAVIDRFGGLEVLTLHTLPAPELDAGEVLIALDTAGMGSWDADIREGWRPTGMRVRFPLVRHRRRRHGGRGRFPRPALRGRRPRLLARATDFEPARYAGFESMPIGRRWREGAPGDASRSATLTTPHWITIQQTPRQYPF